MSLSKPWSTAEAFHILGSLAKVPLMKRPLTVPAKKSLAKYKQPSSLVLWLRFWTGAGATVYDFSRYGNNGAVIGMTWGKDGGLTVGFFNGVADYLQVPDAASLDLTSALTVVAWFKSSVIDNHPIISKRSVLTCNYQISIMATRKIEFFHYDGGVRVFLSTGTLAFDGTWQNPTTTVDTVADLVTFYFKGVYDSAVADVWSLIANAFDLYIGRDGATGADYLTGYLAEVRIHSQALSVDEQRALYLGLI